MQVTPLAERPCPTPPNSIAPDLENAKFANRDTVVLPDEMVARILMYLGTTDIAVCRSVSRQWQTVIDARHLLARSFYRDCHLTQRINSLAAQRNLAVERYHSHIRGWLADFGNRGRETAKQLDNVLEDKHFPEVLFFSIPKLLLNSKELTYQNIATIRHSDIVRDARFSPDGKYLVTVSDENDAKLCELEGGQWREKVILRHSPWVRAMGARFSPDGKYLVTVSHNNAAKLWELQGGQWREKVTLRHSAWVMRASFSFDGNHLVTTSSDGICKIWRLEDDQWQEKVTIKHSQQGSRSITDAQFSPDGKYFLIASLQGIVKIWKLVDGQWRETFTINHCYRVRNARFSPDGKHLVTVTSGENSGGIPFNQTKFWELVDNQSQEKVTTQHWQEKATIEHSDIVNDVHFSLDGKHLVTIPRDDGSVKICGLEGGKWQEKSTIRLFDSVANASFSRDGKLLVIASRNGSVEICGLVKGKWQVKATIRHCKAVTNAHFGPDDYQIVTACCDNTAKIWMLKNKESDDNSELVTSL